MRAGASLLTRLVAAGVVLVRSTLIPLGGE
jgi:hypothetical protein